MGAQQQWRRRVLTDHLRLRDLTVPAAPAPPFASSYARALGEPHDPAGEYYLEAFTATATAAAACGIRVVFTGQGGDEIMALRTHERTTPTRMLPEVPWLGPRATAALDQVDANVAPASPTPPPTLMAFAAHNPTLLRHGIWPVSPLADPMLVRFGESLPVKWRQHKKLFRDRLRRAGLPEGVVDPGQPENFLDLMQTGLRLYGLPLLDQMAKESILVDAGYVDREALAAACDRAASANEIPDLLYDTLALETGLRSLLREND